MNVLHIHMDHRFKEKNGDFYSQTQFPYAYFEDFLTVADTVIVHARVSNALDEHLKVVCSGPRVQFKLYNSIAERVLYHVKNIRRADAKILLRLPSNSGIVIGLVSKIVQDPYVILVSGDPFETMRQRNTFVSKIYAPMYSALNKFIGKRADSAIYVTKSYLQKKIPCVSPSQASISNVYLSDNDFSPHRESGVNIARKIRIGLVASLIGNRKGIDTAFRAIALLRSRYDVILSIVGEGNKETHINAMQEVGLSSACVVFEGVMDRTELNSWFHQVDIYIQPSRHEGLPRALIEAMAHGIPSVGSSIGGIPELLMEELTFDAEDFTGLAAVVEKLIQDKSLYVETSKSLSKKAQNFHASELSKKRKTFLLNYFK